MKKLFTFALSAVALMALSACGGANYSKDVLSAEKDGLSFHAVGGWGVWEAKDENKMTATSVAEVAKLDKAVAKKLSERNLVYLYQFDIEIKGDAGWTKKALVNGEVKEIDGSHAVKAIAAEYNSEEQTYTNKYWITNPGDNNNCNAEALTDNIFMPPFQKETDENGFSWADDPVHIGEEGKYHFVVAQYKEVSSATVYGFGFALIAAK